MKVSFIIPLYNCLAHTRECLRTLEPSLPRDLDHEIILIDDGSTDGTREWLAHSCSSHTVILNDQNLGYAAANNRAVESTRGEQLVLLNNDLIFAPGWFEPMQALQKQLKHPGVIGNLQYDAGTGRLDHAGIDFDHKGKPGHDRALPLPRVLFPGYRSAPAVTGACLLISADLWRELGGFDEGFRNGGEDVDLCLKARAAGRTNAVALRSTIQHHVSASPGRKLHDEANSRRLTTRWRHEITQLSARSWARNFLESQWGRSREPRDICDALTTLAYFLGLKTSVPAVVSAGINTALVEEISRWERLLPNEVKG